MPSTPFIANAETKVSVRRSIEQIQALVERFRAREFRTIYGDEGVATAVRFTITDPHLSKVEGEAGVFTVELTAPTEWLSGQFYNRKATWNRQRSQEQAERVAWRQLHDIIRASLIGVEAGLFTVGEAFLANLIVRTPVGDQLLGQVLMEQRLLTPSDGRLLLGKG